MKSIDRYRALILDVDGTLYFQGRLRVLMAAELAWNVLLRRQSLRDIQVIRMFRSLREMDIFAGREIATYPYELVAETTRLSVDRVRTVVDHWMQVVPLRHLRSCRDDDLHRMIAKVRSLSRPVIIAYSDYPAAAKLAALAFKVDHVFSAVDADINCLKPDPRGLEAILLKLALEPEGCLFIGDRDEKDGLCARRAGVDYVILPKSRAARRRLYRSPVFEPAG